MVGYCALTGVLRPAMIKLGGDPVPGVCKGLKAGLTGMRVGGKRSFVVPPGERRGRGGAQFA
jgi:FKBP-type peptidyl-prolyl cis-trans isomerase